MPCGLRASVEVRTRPSNFTFIRRTLAEDPLRPCSWLPTWLPKPQTVLRCRPSLREGLTKGKFPTVSGARFDQIRRRIPRIIGSNLLVHERRLSWGVRAAGAERSWPHVRTPQTFGPVPAQQPAWHHCRLMRRRPTALVRLLDGQDRVLLFEATDSAWPGRVCRSGTHQGAKSSPVKARSMLP